MLRLTEEDIERGKSPRGAWTAKQLREWGVPWPPPKGWKQDLLAGREVGKPRNKFGAQRTVVDGETFDSAAEAGRWAALRLMQRAGMIAGLVRQPAFDLVVNGEQVGRYTGDFTYREGGVDVVEDVKGVLTEAASLRIRLFRALYPGIELRIVDGSGRVIGRKSPAKPLRSGPKPAIVSRRSKPATKPAARTGP